VKTNRAIQIDNDFVQDLEKKTAQEIREMIQCSINGMTVSTYDLLRGSYIVELRGFYREYGYEDFEAWLTKETFLTSYSQFRDYLLVAKRYSRMIVDKIGFQKLAFVERLSLPENSRETVVNKIEHDIETGKQPPSKKQILSLANPLVVRKQNQSEPRLIEVLRTKLKVANAKVREQDGKIRELNEKLLRAEMKIEDQARYIGELQRGTRAV